MRAARYTRASSQLSTRHFGERFFYVRSGEGVLEIAGERHELRAGRFVHYSSHLEHAVTVTSEEPLETVARQPMELTRKDAARSRVRRFAHSVGDARPPSPLPLHLLSG